jgi:chemotaxis protein MotB
MYKIILLAFGSVIALMSCVTSGKYNEMVFQRDSLRTSNDSLEKVIYWKNISIADLKFKLDELTTDFNNQKNAYNSLKETYDKLKEASSDQLKGMLTSIERMQKDLNEQKAKYDEVNAKLKAREDKINELKTKLTNALIGFKDKGLDIYVKDGKVYVSLSNQLLFQSGKTDIDKNGQDALLGLANVLNTQPDINILVEGHTDSVAIRGSAKFKDNWDLSVLRATEVVRFLTENGKVTQTRIIASGRGEYFPIRTGGTAEDLAANRRTEIILTPKLEELFEIIK